MSTPWRVRAYTGGPGLALTAPEGWRSVPPSLRHTS